MSEAKEKAKLPEVVSEADRERWEHLNEKLSWLQREEQLLTLQAEHVRKEARRTLEEQEAAKRVIDDRYALGPKDGWTRTTGRIVRVPHLAEAANG